MARKILFFLGTMCPTLPLMAEESTTLSGSLEKGIIALSAGLAIALAALGGGIGQSRAAAAAMEGTARNPEAGKRIFILLILALALIESLVIYALVVAFSLIGKM